MNDASFKFVPLESTMYRSAAHCAWRVYCCQWVYSRMSSSWHSDALHLISWLVSLSVLLVWTFCASNNFERQRLWYCLHRPYTVISWPADFCHLRLWTKSLSLQDKYIKRVNKLTHPPRNSARWYPYECATSELATLKLEHGLLHVSRGLKGKIWL